MQNIIPTQEQKVKEKLNKLEKTKQKDFSFIYKGVGGHLNLMSTLNKSIAVLNKIITVLTHRDADGDVGDFQIRGILCLAQREQEAKICFLGRYIKRGHWNSKYGN